jgi:branched-chain amino acid transport system permease protein
VQLGVPGQAGEQLGPLFLRPLATRRQERAAREVALRWLGFVGLADLASARVESLGFGQQKLVALARILATDAQILLLDEPASGIDYQWLDELLGLVSQLRDQGRTVCIVEHNLDVVGRLADHVYFMEVGAVTAEGSFTELTGDPRLAEAYFGAA